MYAVLVVVVVEGMVFIVVLEACGWVVVVVVVGPGMGRGVSRDNWGGSGRGMVRWW